MARPEMSRVPEFYHVYINQVNENDLPTAFQNQSAAFIRFMQDLPVSKRDFRYAEGKWTIKEVLQHIIDAERVFVYRALCIARKDTTPLPSFDENAYADNSKAEKRDWDDLIKEFKVTRESTEILF